MKLITNKKAILLLATAGMMSQLVSNAVAQQSAQQKSVGHGWPIPVAVQPYDGYPEEQFVGSVTPWYYQVSASASGGAAPAGVAPLKRDLFTSDDFYADKASWTDPRYYRCNSPIALDSIRGDYSTGPGAIVNNDAATASWGHCERDYPREAIVSPYPFKTAQAHYQALMNEAKAAGGPTKHTKESLPNWNGRYTRNLNLVFGRGRKNGEGPALPADYSEPPQWVVGWATQVPTMLSLLTPEYQQRYVQAAYHKVNSNAAQFSLMFCRPEGLLRWWSGPGGPSQLDITVVPGRVQFMGGTDNALRQVQIGREFNTEGAVPRLGQDVRHWLGDTVGFWNGNTLVTWTSNVQGWYTHGSWEYSSQMQLIEIWSERHDKAGKFLGLEHETIFYDPEAFVAPMRDMRFFSYTGDYAASAPITMDHCNQTIFLGPDGRAAPVPPGTTIQYKVLDLYNRPWAKVWEEYFEKNMKKPKADDSLGGFK